MVWDSTRIDIYESRPNARFALGSSGTNPLLCFGVNPSTATPEKPDPTIRIVSNVATRAHDGFIMFNLYPQRSTDPDQLHRRANHALVEENLAWITHFVAGRALDVYGAWGALIGKRDYLAIALREIVAAPDMRSLRWHSRLLTINGHPPHPRGVAAATPLARFDVRSYLAAF